MLLFGSLGDKEHVVYLSREVDSVLSQYPVRTCNRLVDSILRQHRPQSQRDRETFLFTVSSDVRGPYRDVACLRKLAAVAERVLAPPVPAATAAHPQKETRPRSWSEVAERVGAQLRAMPRTGSRTAAVRARLKELRFDFLAMSVLVEDSCPQDF